MGNLVKPTLREAILVNAWDIFPNYSSENMVFRGNKRVFELAAVLAGSVPQGYAQYGPMSVGSLEDFWVDECVAHQRRADIPYSVSLIFPTDGQVVQCETAFEIAAKSRRSDSLTLFYFTSHGFPGKMCLRNGELTYDSLLKKLDGIAGKKVLVVFACHSGSLFKVLSDHPARENYAAFCSTHADERGSNWGEDKLQAILCQYLVAKTPLSRLVFPKQVENQHPQSKCYFDTVL